MVKNTICQRANSFFILKIFLSEILIYDIIVYRVGRLMETKHKNALIGALLAVVFVMAVGYAAFAQQLTINGSASISSRWDVHIKDIQGQVTNSSTAGDNTTDAGNPTHDTTTANFTTKLVSPGDQVTYTVTVENSGSIDAQLNDIVLSAIQVIQLFIQ